ncbi:MAG: hypothetical protein GX639_01360 [Fibrobacter sp.]|nr:hypothetical protein [Fibrobacter sp.]
MKNWYVGISDIPLHMALLKTKRKPKMLFCFDKEVNKYKPIKNHEGYVKSRMIHNQKVPS